jgi:hypothetical protein
MNSRKLKYILFVIVSLCFFSSCTKKIIKPPEELIGSWEWERTDFSAIKWNGIQYDTTIYNIYPENLGFTAFFELKRNGRMSFYKDNKPYYHSYYSNKIDFNKIIFKNDSIGYEFKDFPATHIYIDEEIFNAPEYSLRVYTIPYENLYITTNYFKKQ